MTEAERNKISVMRRFQVIYEHLEDGAFFALGHDMYDWDESDWAWFYQNA